jgi:RNase P/RNase MRP subunit p29
MTFEDVLQSEFIGRHIRVKSKKIEGMVIDETKNSFLVKTKTGNKRVLKNNSIFTFDDIDVNGKLILMRPEDRIKIKWN